MEKRRIVSLMLPAVLALTALALLLFYPDTDASQTSHSAVPHVNTGHIFGTYYNIRYSSPNDLEKDILVVLQEFDNSLSTFNPKSVISLINNNKSDKTDHYFVRMFETAQQVSELSDGAFDITVAPLVNAWGFGFRNKEHVTPELIDSLREFVGYDKIRLEGDRLVKSDSRIMLDASAIAKGYSCDVVADFLESKDIANYLVDIGGEIRCKGVNADSQLWSIGIDRPQDDLLGQNHELQAIVRSDNLAMATSGNYRQFYYDNGVRRSHTIDPRTGYPVNHNLLSATVTAPTCMQADALATACMVLGERKALEMIESLPDIECMLIVAHDTTEQVIMTDGLRKIADLK